jgi:hypothetical protein
LQLHEDGKPARWKWNATPANALAAQADRVFTDWLRQIGTRDIPTLPNAR